MSAFVRKENISKQNLRHFMPASAKAEYNSFGIYIRAVMQESVCVCVCVCLGNG